MTKELQVVDLTTDEVVTRVDVSLRSDEEVEKARRDLEARLDPNQELREAD